MKSKYVFMFLVLICSLIIIGLTMLAGQLFSDGRFYESIAAILGMLGLLILFAIVLKKIYIGLKSGFPLKDERTTKLKMYAAGYAYFASLYIWLIILILHRHIQFDDALITGLFGMVLSFGISLIVLNKRKGLG